MALAGPPRLSAAANAPVRQGVPTTSAASSPNPSGAQQGADATARTPSRIGATVQAAHTLPT